MASTTTLSEDAIDDLLYFARTNSLDELREFAGELASVHNEAIGAILRRTRDPATGNTVLHYAAANGHLSVLEYVRTALASPAADTKGAGPAQHTVKSSADLAALANMPNDAGNTSLHWAALNGHLACVEDLVKNYGADVTALNAAGHDAVYEAEINGKDDVMQWLLQEGGSVLEQALGAAGEGDAEMDDPEAAEAGDADIVTEGGEGTHTGFDDAVKQLEKNMEQQKIQNEAVN